MERRVVWAFASEKDLQAATANRYSSRIMPLGSKRNMAYPFCAIDVRRHTKPSGGFGLIASAREREGQ